MHQNLLVLEKWIKLSQHHPVANLIAFLERARNFLSKNEYIQGPEGNQSKDVIEGNQSKDVMEGCLENTF